MGSLENSKKGLILIRSMGKTIYLTRLSNCTVVQFANMLIWNLEIVWGKVPFLLYWKRQT